MYLDSLETYGCLEKISTITVGTQGQNAVLPFMKTALVDMAAKIDERGMGSKTF